jgi:hypothetical protein
MPRPLAVEVKGCEGEVNAWYGEGMITVCYEYLAGTWARAASSKRPSSVTLEDAFVGPTIDVFLDDRRLLA